MVRLFLGKDFLYSTMLHTLEKAYLGIQVLQSSHPQPFECTVFGCEKSFLLRNLVKHCALHLAESSFRCTISVVTTPSLRMITLNYI